MIEKSEFTIKIPRTEKVSTLPYRFNLRVKRIGQWTAYSLFLKPVNYKSTEYGWSGGSGTCAILSSRSVILTAGQWVRLAILKQFYCCLINLQSGSLHHGQKSQDHRSGCQKIEVKFKEGFQIPDFKELYGSRFE
jgi:hypothetical protein